MFIRTKAVTMSKPMGASEMRPKSATVCTVFMASPRSSEGIRKGPAGIGVSWSMGLLMPTASWREAGARSAAPGSLATENLKRRSAHEGLVGRRRCAVLGVAREVNERAQHDGQAEFLA